MEKQMQKSTEEDQGKRIDLISKLSITPKKQARRKPMPQCIFLAMAPTNPQLVGVALLSNN